jgi:two-component system sensor histidine kinase QseC
MRSLRGRLTVWLLAGIGLLLAAGGLLLDRVISARLLREHDAALLDKARSLVNLTELKKDGQVWLESSEELLPEFAAAREPSYFEIWQGDGSVVERSRSLGRHDLARTGSRLDHPRLSGLILPDGRCGRQAEISFHPRAEIDEDQKEEPAPAAGSPVVTLAVAQSREDLDALLASLRVALAVVVLALLAGTAVLVKFAIDLGLAPLVGLARRLEGMDAESLSETLEAADAPAELAPVIQHLNGLLARLDSSFARERSFSANLAHELRTPLAELRTVAEVALKWPDDPASWEASLHEIRGIGLQMEKVVGNLLTLARCDARQQMVERSEVPLRELAASCWTTVAVEAGEKGMTLDLDIPAGMTVRTDREKLSLILANLFANAVAHGSPGKPVACAANGAFTLRIGNFTERLTADDLPRIFDRFWRKDPARTGGRHIGLGLALVAALCDLLAIEKEARLRDGYFEISLSQPSQTAG